MERKFPDHGTDVFAKVKKLQDNALQSVQEMAGRTIVSVEETSATCHTIIKFADEKYILLEAESDGYGSSEIVVDTHPNPWTLLSCYMITDDEFATVDKPVQEAAERATIKIEVAELARLQQKYPDKIGLKLPEDLI
jgi:hypothetical protein